MKAKLDSLEGISDELAAHYEQRDGEDGYYLKVEPVGGLELADVKAMRRALDEERGNRRALEKFGDITPEKAKKALARVEELEAKLEAGSSSKSDEIEALRAEYRRKGEEFESKAKEERAYLEGLLDKAWRKDEALKLLREGGFKSAAEVMLPHVLPSLRLVRDKDGRLTREIEVVNDAGTRRTGAKPGSDMTPAERIAELREDSTFSRWADGTDRSGAGTQTDGASTPLGSAPRVLSSVSTVDDLEAIANGSAVRSA